MLRNLSNAPEIFQTSANYDELSGIYRFPQCRRNSVGTLLSVYMLRRTSMKHDGAILSRPACTVRHADSLVAPLCQLSSPIRFAFYNFEARIRESKRKRCKPLTPKNALVRMERFQNMLFVEKLDRQRSHRISEKRLKTKNETYCTTVLKRNGKRNLLT